MTRYECKCCDGKYSDQNYFHVCSLEYEYVIVSGHRELKNEIGKQRKGRRDENITQNPRTKEVKIKVKGDGRRKL